MMISAMSRLTIDLAALSYNYRQLRAKCAPGVKFMGVVKADAYGHGLVPVARTLVGDGVDYLGVASLEEGLALRRAGLKVPVLLLMGLLPQESEAAVGADLEVVLFRRDIAEALEAAGRTQGKKAKVHIKVDTGMGRLGLLPGEVLPFLEALRDCPHLEVVGLVSHLAAADAEDKTYTLKQLQEFATLVASVRQSGWPVPVSHLANSAALTEIPEAHFGLVRPGIMLYGSPAAPQRPAPVPLKAVMSFTSEVLQVKEVPPGTCISYGCTYTTERWTKLAVVPVGYCNGYSRLLSNRGAMLIKGRRVPIRGRVCMNLTMVDVSDLPGVAAGETVTLLGEDQGSRLTADELAAWAQTISYEIYCALGTANPRHYIGDHHHGA